MIVENTIVIISSLLMAATTFSQVPVNGLVGVLIIV